MDELKVGKSYYALANPIELTMGARRELFTVMGAADKQMQGLENSLLGIFDGKSNPAWLGSHGCSIYNNNPVWWVDYKIRGIDRARYLLVFRLMPLFRVVFETSDTYQDFEFLGPKSAAEFYKSVGDQIWYEMVEKGWYPSPRKRFVCPQGCSNNIDILNLSMVTMIGYYLWQIEKRVPIKELRKLRTKQIKKQMKTKNQQEDAIIQSEKVRMGAPVNTKSLLAFIFNQMERLNSGEIDANTACAQAKLASQASNVLNYELKRTIVQMRLKEIGSGVKSTVPRLREIESKAFDDAVIED